MASRDVTALDFSSVEKPLREFEGYTRDYVTEIQNIQKAIDSINEENPGSEAVLVKTSERIGDCAKAVAPCPDIAAEITQTLKQKSEALEAANSEASRKLEDLI